MIYLKLAILITFITTNSFASIQKIIDVKSQKVLSKKELLDEIEKNPYLIWGEVHNTTNVQNAQAELLKLIHKNLNRHISLTWEFLNITDNQLNVDWSSIIHNNGSIPEFLEIYTSSPNSEYIQLLEVLKNTAGDLYPGNLPRSIKQQIIKQGIGSVNPSLIPEDHYLSGPLYYERFESAMGGHAPTNLVKAYYEVQCLVDSVLANEFLKNQQQKAINIALAGHFHTDFYDGLLEKVSRGLKTAPISIKFTTNSQNTSPGIDQKYGPEADFLIITK